MKSFINQIQPWIGEEESEQLLRVIESTFVTEHNLTREFEAKVRDLTGSKHAIAMTNGTVALFCCLKSLGIGPGDEVIVPDMTFIATSNSVIMAGATPVFCDIKLDDMSLDVEKVKECITSKTKAIMPVHLYGGAANIKELKRVCEEFNLFLVEDAAQGVGVKYDGKHVGTFGDLGILSFYGNKTITCGEGGVVLTDDDDLAASCYRLKNHGRDTKGIFVHSHIGFNFAFTEMQAAIGIAQLNKLEKIISRKKEIYDRYILSLSEIEGLRPLVFEENISPVYWFTSFFTNERASLAKHLDDNKIQTRQFFYPLHKQPCYGFMGLDCESFPNSSQSFEEGISLPSSYNLTESQQDYIISCIKDYYKK
tara:strand:+ start:254 stop:1351 length:1098 start_codon:yes stop_codon:yes gene_type:complete